MLSRVFRPFLPAGSRSLTSLLDREPKAPLVQTEFPGPKSLEYKKQLESIQGNVGAVQVIPDFDRSIGNYLCDVDGNYYLDCFSQIASLPLGYNNPAMLSALHDESNMRMALNRPALGVFPSAKYIEMVSSTLMTIAPTGLRYVQTMMCGTCANENALKQVFINHMRKSRKGADFTQEDITTVMKNQPPGAPRLSALSFKHAHHGRSLATLSMTHVKPIHKLDIPAFDWPIAPFPQLKYPLDRHANENEREENRCLQEVRSLIQQWSTEKQCPVAAVIVEPIQAHGGDNHASAEFFRGLQGICKENDIAFMVDEVHVAGGNAGRMWIHESWDLRHGPPDVVAFAKKLCTGGYFFADHLKLNEPYRVFNTWLGDPSKLVLLEAMLKFQRENDLMSNAADAGKALLGGLERIQVHSHRAGQVVIHRYNPWSITDTRQLSMHPWIVAFVVAATVETTQAENTCCADCCPTKSCYETRTIVRPRGFNRLEYKTENFSTYKENCHCCGPPPYNPCCTPCCSVGIRPRWCEFMSARTDEWFEKANVPIPMDRGSWNCSCCGIPPTQPPPSLPLPPTPPKSEPRTTTTLKTQDFSESTRVITAKPQRYREFTCCPSCCDANYCDKVYPFGVRCDCCHLPPPPPTEIPEKPPTKPPTPRPPLDNPCCTPCCATPGGISYCKIMDKHTDDHFRKKNEPIPIDKGRWSCKCCKKPPTKPPPPPPPPRPPLENPCCTPCCAKRGGKTYCHIMDKLPDYHFTDKNEPIPIDKGRWSCKCC